MGFTMGVRRLTKSLLVRGKKIFASKTNKAPEVNMSFIRKIARWFRFSSRPRTERSLDEVMAHRQTAEELERIKARAFYLSRGF